MKPVVFIRGLKRAKRVEKCFHEVILLHLSGVLDLSVKKGGGMWSKEVEELNRRKELAYRLGGEKAIKRQHDLGKMTVRERIDALLDNGTFRETGVLAGEAKYENNNQDLVEFTPCPIVMGTGKINGRNVIVQGDDFTIRGASVAVSYTHLTLPTICSV